MSTLENEIVAGPKVASEPIKELKTQSTSMNNIKQQFGEAHSVLIQFISNNDNFKKIEILKILNQKLRPINFFENFLKY